MLLSVSNACKSYFRGIPDICAIKKIHHEKDLLAEARILSYLTLVVPLCVGVVFSVSLLLERVHQEKSVSSDDSPVFCVWKRLFGQPLNEELDQFFRSHQVTRKIFFINKYKIGLVFNPKNEPLKLGFFSPNDTVIIVADTTLPEEIIQRILRKLPPKSSYSTLIYSSINGVPTFKAFDFE
jgi:hypothetical protein